MKQAITLAVTETGDGPAVILLHGLFGNSRNLQSLANALANTYRVLSPDLRNHGRSPHADNMDFPVLADDIITLLDLHQLDRAALIGHSLGGKVAMATALLHADRVERVAALDIAPVTYRTFFNDLMQQLQSLPLERIRSRADADQWLANRITDSRLRAFLLQNLDRTQSGFRWRINLPALQDQRQALAGFPDQSEPYPGPALFLHGEQSDYVQAEHHTAIQRLFPRANIQAIPGAGHWLHIEQPQRVVAALQEFLVQQS